MSSGNGPRRPWRMSDGVLSFRICRGCRVTCPRDIEALTLCTERQRVCGEPGGTEETNETGSEQDVQK